VGAVIPGECEHLPSKQRVLIRVLPLLRVQSLIHSLR
jgi:hypothetical protein